MAKARKCDRCGGYYEKNTVNARDEYGRPILDRFYFMRIYDTRNVSANDYDLCDSCAKKLYDFLLMEEDENETENAKKIVRNVVSINEDIVEIQVNGTNYVYHQYRGMTIPDKFLDLEVVSADRVHNTEGLRELFLVCENVPNDTRDCSSCPLDAVCDNVKCPEEE